MRPTPPSASSAAACTGRSTTRASSSGAGGPTSARRTVGTTRTWTPRSTPMWPGGAYPASRQRRRVAGCPPSGARRRSRRSPSARRRCKWRWVSSRWSSCRRRPTTGFSILGRIVPLAGACACPTAPAQRGAATARDSRFGWARRSRRKARARSRGQTPSTPSSTAGLRQPVERPNPSPLPYLGTRHSPCCAPACRLHAVASTIHTVRHSFVFATVLCRDRMRQVLDHLHAGGWRLRVRAARVPRQLALRRTDHTAAVVLAHRLGGAGCGRRVFSHAVGRRLPVGGRRCLQLE
mmetsp:Transcript_74304/g.204721  ORF Transcript_74304/g.204721 Transcript_74304/m.204721 type:complete len:293 (+) Transcript_74304:600-1478(+)